MNAWSDRIIGFVRGLRSTRHEAGPWDGESRLAPIHSRIGRLDAASPPDLVRDTHLELLLAFGESIDLGFHAQSALEPPTEDLITVFGRFDKGARERQFGLQLQSEETDAGHCIRVAWLIDFYLPKRWRRRGAGTALMAALLELWEQAGVAEARTTTVGDGQLAFPTWGFLADPRGRHEDGLLPLHLALPRSPQPAAPVSAKP